MKCLSWEIPVHGQENNQQRKMLSDLIICFLRIQAKYALG
jgi:hypothetical protein